MRSLKVLGSLALIGVLLVGCSGENGQENNNGAVPQNESGAAQNEGTQGGTAAVTLSGEKLYTERCASCHGDGTKNITALKADLTKEDIRNIIQKGKGAMPGGLTNEEENEVLTNWLFGE